MGCIQRKILSILKEKYMYKEVPKHYDHQLDALQKIKDLPFFALFMEQGTGKSKVAISHSYLLLERKEIDCVIVIAPDSVKDQWVNEQYPEHFTLKEWNGYVWEGAKTKKSKIEFENKLLDKEKFFICSINIEAFQSNNVHLYIKMILKERTPLVIIDESTRIKNGRKRIETSKRKGAKRTNDILDLFENTKNKCILTGTPTPNSPFDLWSQFEFLQKNFFGIDYFPFTHRHGILIQKRSREGRKFSTVLDQKTFNIAKNKLDKMEKLSSLDLEVLSDETGIKVKDLILIRGMDRYRAYKNLQELREQIEPVTVFIKKEDCLDLPEKVYEKLYCNLSKEQKTIYESLKKEMMAEYMGEEITLTNKVVMYLRLQMVSGGLFPFSKTDMKLDEDGEPFFESSFKYKYIENNSKIDVLMEDLEEVSEETSIIVWAKFRGEIELICDKLLEKGYSAEKYYGGSSPEVITRFKSKETRVLVASALKGGEGLNLQICTLQYFYSNSFKADSRLQAEDRSHRIGQLNKVTYKDIICRNSVDERIYEVLARKENLINYFRSSKEDIRYL